MVTAIDLSDRRLDRLRENMTRVGAKAKIVRADVLDYLRDTPANRALIARIRPAVARYRNIGVRIEDDYFITANGVERVSEGAPRESAEISIWRLSILRSFISISWR